jgi:hypothetical protein
MRRSWILVLGLAGCTRAARQPPAIRPLTRAAVANATFRTEYALEGSDSSATITLTNGHYESPDGTLAVTLLPDVAFGDLDDDTVPDAAAVLVSQPGGSGSFYDLVVLAATADGPRQVATALLGDRVDIESLVIIDGQIALQLLTQGPADPLCCPTQREARTYALVGDSLALVGVPVLINGAVAPDTGGTHP